MIVCSCNCLTDAAVRIAVIDDPHEPRWSPGKVYQCLGCTPKCGRCVPTIRQIVKETLLDCGRSTCEGCPMLSDHSQSTAVRSEVSAVATA
jgi:bacterioferritin-associated ferredoxin